VGWTVAAHDVASMLPISWDDELCGGGDLSSRACVGNAIGSLLAMRITSHILRRALSLFDSIHHILFCFGWCERKESEDKGWVDRVGMRVGYLCIVN
jgi:hypothetical protein